MKLIPLKRFTKAYRRLQPGDRGKVDEALILFETDPFYPALRNHPLKGSMVGMRAISAGFDLRILFQEEGGNMIIYLLDVGSHSQVY